MKEQPYVYFSTLANSSLLQFCQRYFSILCLNGFILFSNEIYSFNGFFNPTNLTDMVTCNGLRFLLLYVCVCNIDAIGIWSVECCFVFSLCVLLWERKECSSLSTAVHIGIKQWHCSICVHRLHALFTLQHFVFTQVILQTFSCMVCRYSLVKQMVALLWKHLPNLEIAGGKKRTLNKNGMKMTSISEVACADNIRVWKSKMIFVQNVTLSNMSRIESWNCR